MASTDSELIKSIQNGDIRAFESVFRAHYPRLVGFGVHFLKDAAIAEDIAQEMFVKLWERREDFAIQGEIVNYLLSAMRNACLNHIKHLKVRAAHETHVKAAPPIWSDDPAKALEQAELRARIDLAMEKLPDRCAEIFQLSRFEGLKYQEIADRLGLSIKTVEAQMGKALKILRSELRPFLPLILLFLGTKL